LHQQLSKKVRDKPTKHLAEPVELHFRKEEDLQKIRESGHIENEF